jgi:hypothetical protein
VAQAADTQKKLQTHFQDVFILLLLARTVALVVSLAFLEPTLAFALLDLNFHLTHTSLNQHNAMYTFTMELLMCVCFQKIS